MYYFINIDLISYQKTILIQKLKLLSKVLKYNLYYFLINYLLFCCYILILVLLVKIYNIRRLAKLNKKIKKYLQHHQKIVKREHALGKLVSGHLISPSIKIQE